MADRRRINGPVGTTCPPVFDLPPQQQQATRSPDSIRKIFIKTGVTPSASGSAFLELESPTPNDDGCRKTNLKLTCTIHGPRSLPRSAPFSPHIILSTHVKYAPFATRRRRGYLRDSSERDLGVHLEAALRGAIIADRWPKSGVDIIVTIVEGDQEPDSLLESPNDESWGMMNVLSGCVTVASAAIADAGIDCVGTVAGGVAALVAKDKFSEPEIVVDPILADYDAVLAACCVAYITSRDEITNLWFKGLSNADMTVYNKIIQRGLIACRGADQAIIGSLKETVTNRQDYAS